MTEESTWVLMRWRLSDLLYWSENGDTSEVARAKHFASEAEAKKFAARLPKWPEWRARRDHVK